MSVLLKQVRRYSGVSYNNLFFWLNQRKDSNIYDFGIKKLIAVKKEKYNLQTQIQSLMNQQLAIQSEITKLKLDTMYIEQLAREKFLMVKPGEKVFKVMDSKKVN